MLHTYNHPNLTHDSSVLRTVLKLPCDILLKKRNEDCSAVTEKHLLRVYELALCTVEFQGCVMFLNFDDEYIYGVSFKNCPNEVLTLITDLIEGEIKIRM